MAGGVLRNPAFGTTTEHLAAAFLSAVAFTTQVRRENDVGHDFHCVLHEPSDSAETVGRASGILSAGPPFNVQVKSNFESITFEQPHARKWIGTQQSPLFVCVVKREELRLDFYSTWYLHYAIQYYGYGGDGSDVSIIELTFPEPDTWSGFAHILDHKTSQGLLSVPLGPAILSTKLDEVMDPEKAKRIAVILGDWIALDRANIVRRAMRMHWVYGPDIWQPNARLDEQTQMTGNFLYNPRNLERDPDDPHRPTVSENLVRSAYALQFLIKKHREDQPGAPIPKITPELEDALRAVTENARDIITEDRVIQTLLTRVGA